MKGLVMLMMFDLLGASLPDIGIDVGSFIAAGITAIGAIVAVAVGGFVAFQVAKKGLSWVGQAMGGGSSSGYTWGISPGDVVSVYDHELGRNVDYSAEDAIAGLRSGILCSGSGNYFYKARNEEPDNSWVDWDEYAVIRTSDGDSYALDADDLSRAVEDGTVKYRNGHYYDSF